MLQLLGGFLFFFLGEKQRARATILRGKKWGSQRVIDYFEVEIHKPIRLFGEAVGRLLFNQAC